MFDNRTYRKLHQKKGLVSFDVTVKQTNLNIQADADLTRQAIKAVLRIRNTLETYIQFHPEFATTLEPVNTDSLVPEPIRDMIKAGRLAGVGPMAAVAGAVAQFTGQALLESTKEVLVENGGDIFIKSNTKTIFSIYAGDHSPFSKRCGICVEKRDTPYGLCTSSGMLGHSTSFGKADAATVLSDSCSIADAVATALGNQVKTASDIQSAIDKGRQINGVQGIVILKDNNIGAWGDLKLVQL